MRTSSLQEIVNELVDVARAHERIHKTRLNKIPSKDFKNLINYGRCRIIYLNRMVVENNQRRYLHEVEYEGFIFRTYTLKKYKNAT